MLSIFAKLLSILNSETAAWQISLAFSFAMVAGLTPVAGIHNLFVLFLILILRVNLSSFIFGLVIFSGLSFILDPLFHHLGSAILAAASLQDLWTSLYNNPFMRLTRFNNTIVMGSLALSLFLFIPLFFLFNFLIKKYRETILEKIRNTKVMQLFKASKFYKVYEKVSYLRSSE
ncbi:MAG: TIGR03546 family protein [Deltaproteobacteria bacterium]|nr:TIGR03546 family protein [Deltaproteobacteria bacterium]